MPLSQKEKVNLQANRLKHVGQKGALVYAYHPASDRWLYVIQKGGAMYLYHPRSDSWLPAQGNDEGALVISSGE